ncbi:MAG: aldehyde dehydrogenase family protein [Solirubrobacterales bacterium]|nr:aldehyde dehydrogenase family protein [Solirubrobacterales bacterium]
MTSTEQQPSQSSVNGASAAKTLEVTEPATGRTISSVPVLDRDGVARLVERARAAQPGWQALGYKARGDLMRDMRAWIVANRKRVIETLCRESGKTYDDAQLELFYCADALGFWAKRAPKWLADERERPHSPMLAGRKVINRYVPYGVVGVIGPWNYPLVNNFGDAIPALMAGNTVILKPASATPLSSMLMAEGMREVGVPDDVFAVANGGGGEVGGALVDAVDMLHFTGSTEVGKRLAEQGATRLLPLTLELGGNDPMIVLRDANLERAANAAVFGAFQNSGQTCISVERVYVEADAYEPFVAKVVEKVRELRQGVPGTGGTVDVGAMTTSDQLDILDEHVRDAVDKGAKLEAGGLRGEGPGQFYAPTVLTGVDHSMKVMREETFGPTLPIMRVADEDEAVRLANDSEYGLDSSVFGGDHAHAERVARRLESGACVVNDSLVNYFAMEIPIGGMKQSGVGARHGRIGIQKYCQRQNLVVTRFGLDRELYYMPYSKRNTKLTELMIRALYGRGARR